MRCISTIFLTLFLTLAAIMPSLGETAPGMGDTPATEQEVGAVESQDSYFMVLFASQSPFWRKPKAHCFATFVKIPDGSAGSAEALPEIHTISWYPAAGRCRVIHPPEQGCNTELDETLARCKTARMNIYKWGPVQIQKEFFEKALERKGLLDAGELRWQAIDKSARRKGIAVNCIHALSDLDCDESLVEFGLCSGCSAAQRMVGMFRKWMIEPEVKHDFICEILGICNQDIIDKSP